LFNGCQDGKQPRFAALILRAGREAMTVLLFFVSFASMFALFASAIAVTSWVLTRCLRALIAPSAVPKRRRDASVDHHLKRAGQ
jgi:hypothetical protein